MDKRSHTDNNVEIVDETPAEDVAELDDVELVEADSAAEEVAELDDVEFVVESDNEFDDAMPESDEEPEEVAELDEPDTLDTLPELADVPAASSDAAPSAPGEAGEQDEALPREEITEIDDERLEVEPAPAASADIEARVEADAAEEIAELDDATDANKLTELGGASDDEASTESDTDERAEPDEMTESEASAEVAEEIGMEDSAELAQETDAEPIEVMDSDEHAEAIDSSDTEGRAEPEIEASAEVAEEIGMEDSAELVNVADMELSTDLVDLPDADERADPDAVADTEASAESAESSDAKDRVELESEASAEPAEVTSVEDRVEPIEVMSAEDRAVSNLTHELSVDLVSESSSDGRAAIEALHGMGFASVELLDRPEKSHSDRESIRHAAESYAYAADLLERQVAHMEQHGEETWYRSHFLGDLNEIGSQAQFEKWGDMQNLNDPTKRHDNHRGIDLRFANESGTVNFEADAKASLSARPLDYYWSRLRKIEAEEESVELFVPYDHEYALKERIDARVEAGKMDKSEATRWKERIHAAAFSSNQYHCLLEQCTADDKPDYISTEKARSLVGQLRAASSYAKQQIEDV